MVAKIWAYGVPRLVNCAAAENRAITQLTVLASTVVGDL
jgi:hypothetical protein